MNRILITGGAGFIGRWASKKFADEGHEVVILDDLSNGSERNIEEFRDRIDFIRGDIKDRELLKELFSKGFDICIHLAAAINVQESIDKPEKTIQDNIMGTYYLLEECRKANTKFVFISSALVYGTIDDGLMPEDHPTKPASPYGATKIAAENLVLSYYYSYKLPVTILRPFSAYGPFQRSDTEGGVMSIFLKKDRDNKPLEVYGDGEQSRDFIYVNDCTDFIYKAAFSKKADGHIFNAGSGEDTKIKNLATKVIGDESKIKYIEHHHPQAEIMKMRADPRKAKELLNWEPKTSLEDGIKQTREWLKTQ